MPPSETPRPSREAQQSASLEGAGIIAAISKRVYCNCISPCKIKTEKQVAITSHCNCNCPENVPRWLSLPSPNYGTIPTTIDVSCNQNPALLTIGRILATQSRLRTIGGRLTSWRNTFSAVISLRGISCCICHASCHCGCICLASRLRASSSRGSKLI